MLLGTLESDQSAVRRPARPRIRGSGGQQCHAFCARPIAGDRHQRELLSSQLEQGNPLAVVADVATAHRGGQPPGPSSEGADFPQRALFSTFRGRCAVDERVRLGCPSRLLVINRVSSELELGSAAEEADDDLTLAADEGDNATILPSGESWGFFHPGEISQALKSNSRRGVPARRPTPAR